jgi:hypothetical protein
MNADPARRSKIAQLPFEIRAELNQRLRNNVTGKKLVAWLNSLKETKAVIAQPEFGGEAVTGQNLSEWRRGGYQDWLRKRERFEQSQEKVEFALAATGGKAEDAANALAASHVVEILDEFEPALLKDVLKEDPAKFADVLHAFAAIERAGAARKAAATAETQGARKIEQTDRKLDQDDQALLLKKITAAGDFLDLFDDKRAMEIAASADARPVKMEKLVQLMFGERPATPTGPKL